MQIPGPTVLITGSSGFRGRRLTSRLLADGVPVKALPMPPGSRAWKPGY